MHLLGSGVEKSHPLAITYLTEASDAGDGRASLLLSSAHSKEFGGSGDQSKVVAYSERAAAQGEARGNSNLGAFAQDSGDLDRAQTFYRKAVCKGDYMAAAHLADLHLVTNKLAVGRSWAILAETSPEQFIREDVAITQSEYAAKLGPQWRDGAFEGMQPPIWLEKQCRSTR
jgi:TPR repeat protein